jgi:hypothetical protein
MPDITPRERIQLQMHQERLGRELKAEMVLKDVTVGAVADAMGLSNRTSLSQYLAGYRLWAGGLEDFKRCVHEAIGTAALAKVNAA